MLKMTIIKLKRIPDLDMYIFFEKGTGKISYISNRYSKASIKYFKSFDPKQESKHIIYLDANNLYGYGISKFLSKSGFKWVDSKEFDLNKHTSNGLKGCALENDFEYPKELRELCNGYSSAPDKIEIKREMLCVNQLKIADFSNIGNLKKLEANVFDKKKYMLHYENLQLYL